MRALRPLFLFITLASGMQGFAEGENANLSIRHWVQQLGDDSFLVRQRAETHLIRAGLPAYPELQRARQSHDLEVVRRAEYILSQIEQVLLDNEDRNVATWTRFYMTASNPAYKARIIWLFADPTSDFPRGEGLQTLCRLVRFEENPTLRLEAVKTLIASPPVSPKLRRLWYRHIRDHFNEPDNDVLSQRLAHYATLWCDLDNADNAITPDLQNRVRHAAAETLRLLDRPGAGPFGAIQIGSGIDILLHYAVAELQDAAGLIEDRDKTATSAIAVEPQPMQTREPIQPITNTEGLHLNEHYHAGLCLYLRFRLHWALKHFQKVMESGDVLLRLQASKHAAEIALDFADYPSAIAYWDKHIEVLNSPDYKTTYNPQPGLVQAQKHRVYCLAAKAAEEKNWTSVRKLIMQLWSVPDAVMEMQDVDLVILAYRLFKEQDGVDDEFREMFDRALKQVWRSILGNYDLKPPEVIYNAAAWLLANTGGDYASALTLAESALKLSPDDVMLLDTLSHVYFLGGKIEEAIRTQEQVVRLVPESVMFRKALERFKRANEPKREQKPEWSTAQ